MNAAPESVMLRAAPAVGRAVGRAVGHAVGHDISRYGYANLGVRVALCAVLAVAFSACTTTVRQVGDTHPVSQDVATHAPPVLDEARELRVAQTALQGGDLDMATHIYARLLQQKPQSVPALTGLGDTLYAVGDYTRADVYYRKAVTLDSKEVPALIGAARVGIRQRHFGNAVLAYRKVLAIQPGNTLAAAGLGAALDLLGDHAGAQATLRAALDATPGDIGLSINLGLSLAMDGKAREGADLLLDVTRFPDAPAQARYDLALAYGLLGDDQEAARLLSDLPKQSVDDNLRYYAALRAKRAAGVTAAAAPAPTVVTAELPARGQPVTAARSNLAATSATVTAPAVAPVMQTSPPLSSNGVISTRLTSRSPSPFNGAPGNQPARLASSQSAAVLP